MTDLTILKYYLEAVSFKEPDSREESPRAFVTISRQAGASGRSVAEAIQAAMAQDGRPFFQGWRIFDRELCEEVAADRELSVLTESPVDERFHSSFADYLVHSLAGLSPQSAVFKKIFRTIRGLAIAGKAIIVGRAGCCVTRGLENGTHIRLVASKTDRLEVMSRHYGLDSAAAEKKMEELDDSRRRLAKQYFSEDIDDPLAYHLVLNMSTMTPAMAARLVMQMVLEKLGKTVLALKS